MLVDDLVMLLANKNCSKAELARRIGDSPQNLGLKFKRDSLKGEDLQKIYKALKIKAEITYTDEETGEEIFRSKI